MSAAHLAPLVFVPSVAIKKILLPTDFSLCSEPALTLAASMARLHHSEIVITHVIAPEPVLRMPADGVGLQYEHERQDARAEMTRLGNAPALQGVSYSLLLESGDLWNVLSSVCEKDNVDLIVAGTHGRGGLRKVFLGSVAEQIYRLADCPVMTVGPETSLDLLNCGRFRSIVFATDFSYGSEQAFPYAIAFTKEHQSRLTLLHVLEEGALSGVYLHERLVANCRGRMQDMISHDLNLPVEPEVLVEAGDAAEEIVRTARHRRADLIVLGVHKSSHAGAVASSHIPWTIASTVVQQAQCPVLTIRG